MIKEGLLPGEYPLFQASNVNIVIYRKEAAVKDDKFADSWIAPYLLFSPTGKVFRALKKFGSFDPTTTFIMDLRYSVS